MPDVPAPTPPPGHTLHRQVAGKFDPPIPVDAFGSLRVWNGAAWLRPDYIGAGDGLYATKTKES